MKTTILEYGAIGDGKTLNTQSIQQAIDACAESGGGQVVIPAGVFVSGSIWLKSHVELHLAHGAVLKASSDYRDYNALDAFPQNMNSPEMEGWVGRHLIIALNQTNIAVTGHGVIDGSGDTFFEPWQKNPWGWNYGWAYGFSREKDKINRRPGQVMCLIECEHIRVTDITFRNAPCWCCFLHGCDYATIRGIHVFNEKHYANTDGIDIDTCRYVTISDCIIDTGDDAIAIRSNAKRLLKATDGCQNITISNCILSSSSCVFRIGVGFGKIRNVTISNIVMHRGGTGLRFERSQIENMTITNIIAENVSCPFDMFESDECDCTINRLVIDGYNIQPMCAARMRAITSEAFSNITIRNMEAEITEAPYELNEKAESQRGEYVFEIQGGNNMKFENVCVVIPDRLKEQWKGIAQFVNCNEVEKIRCNF